MKRLCTGVSRRVVPVRDERVVRDGATDWHKTRLRDASYLFTGAILDIDPNIYVRRTHTAPWHIQVKMDKSGS